MKSCLNLGGAVYLLMLVLVVGVAILDAPTDSNKHQQVNTECVDAITREGVPLTTRLATNICTGSEETVEENVTLFIAIYENTISCVLEYRRYGTDTEVCDEYLRLSLTELANNNSKVPTH